MRNKQLPVVQCPKYIRILQLTVDVQRIQDTRTEEDMIEGWRSHMLDAIRARLQVDVHVRIYFSGGIDSSVVAGMAAHILKDQEVEHGRNNSTKPLICPGIAFNG